MSEKKIPKAKLDRCIELSRRYFDIKTPMDHDLLDKKIEAFNELEREVKVGYIVLSDLMRGILDWYGLKNDATNEDIYKVLEVLGWQVVDDESAEHRAVDE